MNDYSRVIVEAPAKINLSLDITGITGDGYHLLETVMQSVDWLDILTIDKRRDTNLYVSCSDPAVPCGKENLAYKAALAFFAAAGTPVPGLSIHIDKSIPVQAGLAGGSADAAAVLRGLDCLFGTGFSPEYLAEIALPVGADVPFCLTGGCALAQGKGEILTPLPTLPDCLIVIAKPPGGMSTRLAFELFDACSGRIERPDTKAVLAAVKTGDLEELGRHIGNVFGALGDTAETWRLEKTMLDAGAVSASLSGSGSAVFGLFDNGEKASACLRSLREQELECRITRPAEHGASVIRAV